VKPVIGPIHPATDYYLPYMGNISRIFVVSANISSGFYPYPTRTALGGGPPVVEKGEPCAIINFTIRNDYSTQYLPPSANPDFPTEVYVSLTAKIFNGENQINATDLSHVGQPPDAWALADLNSGENSTLSVYLATTSQKEITGFQIVAIDISGYPP
jgi:hypothetical protein